MNNSLSIGPGLSSQSVVGNRVEVTSSSPQSGGILAESLGLNQTQGNAGQMALSEGNIYLSGNATSNYIVGTQSQLSTTGTSSANSYMAFRAGASHSSSSALSAVTLVESSINLFGAGNISNVYGLNFNIFDTGSGHIGNFYAVRIPTLPAVTTGKYSVHSSDPDVVMYHEGRIGVGTSTPAHPLDVNGTIRAVDLVLTSDRRAKEQIASLDASTSLKQICEINPVSFQWKTTGKEDMGVIAQEIEKIFPQFVVTNPDGSKSVKYHSLIAPMISSIQELNEENKKMKEEIKKLKASQKSILERLDAIEKRSPASAR